MPHAQDLPGRGILCGDKLKPERDSFCVEAMGLKDKADACCARWELRNMPDPTVITTQEKAFLDQA